MKEPQVVLVDENNVKIGVMGKQKAHVDGVLHRAFSIFIFNSKGELLIHQREISKYHSGGLWTNTVCSHPSPEETFDEGALRRLKEEMGFETKLTPLSFFIYKAEFDNGLTEHEYDCVYIGKFDGTPNPDPQEIMDYEWINLKDLKSQIKNNPDKFSLWLNLALEKISDEDIQKIL